MSKKIKNLEDALSAFIDGGRIHHAAIVVGDNKMAVRGLMRTDEGVNYIDQFCPNARDVLIPLLDHAEDEVRVTAASALVHSRPDLALPVIEQIRATCITEAHMTAGLIMIHKQVFGYFGLGVCRPDPRYPIPNSEEDLPEPKPN